MNSDCTGSNFNAASCIAAHFDGGIFELARFGKRTSIIKREDKVIDNQDLDKADSFIEEEYCDLSLVSFNLRDSKRKSIMGIKRKWYDFLFKSDNTSFLYVNTKEIDWSKNRELELYVKRQQDHYAFFQNFPKFLRKILVNMRHIFFSNTGL
ncbi:MAG: hypothetical protein ACOCUT_01340 [bacterium]